MKNPYVCDLCGGKKSYKAKMCLRCRGAESRKNRKHGTVNMYVNFGCHCSRCRVAWADAMRKRRDDQRKKLASVS